MLLFSKHEDLSKNIQHYCNLFLLLFLGLSLIFSLSFELVSPSISRLVIQSMAAVVGFVACSWALFKNTSSLNLFYIVLTLFAYLVFFSLSFHQFNFLVTVLSLNIFLGFLLFKFEKAFFLLSLAIFIFTFELMFYDVLWTDYSASQYLINLITFSLYAFLAIFLKNFLNQNQSLIKTLNLSLKKELALNDAIVESITSGIFISTDDESLTPLNKAAKKILKKSKNFIKNLTHTSYKNKKNFEFSLNKKIYKVYTSDLDVNGALKGKVYLASDETETKKLEQDLEQARKLAAVGTLSAGLAHEIRNPLAGMSGSLELLKENQEDKKTQDQLFKTVLREIDRLNSLVTDFLNFSKPTVSKEDQIDILPFFEDVLAVIKKDPIAQEVKIITDIESLILKVDESKLKQVFMNIILNAVQAFDEERVNALALNNESPRVTITGKKTRQKFSVLISDNGVGIAQDELNKIFEPFHTTKDKGTGLGLALSHRILSEHDATINVDSVKDQGTVFKITFKL